MLSGHGDNSLGPLLACAGSGQEGNSLTDEWYSLRALTELDKCL